MYHHIGILFFYRVLFFISFLLASQVSFPQTQISFSTIPTATMTSRPQGIIPAGLQYQTFIAPSYSICIQKVVKEKFSINTGFYYQTIGRKQSFSTAYNDVAMTGYRGTDKYSTTHMLLGLSGTYSHPISANTKLCLKAGSLFNLSHPFNSTYSINSEYINPFSNASAELTIIREETVHPNYKRYSFLFGLGLEYKIKNRWHIISGIDYNLANPIYQLNETYTFDDKSYHISSIQKQSNIGLGIGVNYLVSKN